MQSLKPRFGIDELVKEITQNFRCFGGGQSNEWNPLTIALKNQSPQFAAGVDVKEVVEFISSKVLQSLLNEHTK